MEFYKLQANGNDFILTISDDATMLNIPTLCNRYTGIGADGYINIDNKFNVSIFNADGSKAKMCGNGLRCLVRLLYHLTNNDRFTFYLEGTEVIGYLLDNDYAIEINSPMMVKQNEGYLVNLLNNHYVFMVKEIENFSFETTHKNIAIDNKCNIHAIEIIDKSTFKIKTYEYGVGETLSCGSGTIASFYVGYMLNMLNKKVDVLSSGGPLKCFIKNNKYILQGPATLVYKGDYYGI